MAEDALQRLGPVGPDGVHDDGRRLAHGRRREAGEVDAAAAVVAAVVREPRRLPDGVDRDRLAHRERADAAGVVLGLRRRGGGRGRRTVVPGRVLRLRPLRQLQQVGPSAQQADVVDQLVRPRHAAVLVQRAALAVQRVDEHGQLREVEHAPVVEARLHELAVVLDHELLLGRDAAARAVQVAVAALRAAEGHRLADAAFEQPVGAGDQHLQHVELAAQPARREQARAALGAERRPVQVADRAQLAAAVQVHLLAEQGVMRVQDRPEDVGPAHVRRVGVVVARAARARRRRAGSRRRSCSTCRRPRTSCRWSR